MSPPATPLISRHLRGCSGTKRPFMSCSRAPSTPRSHRGPHRPRPDHFCWASCLFLRGLSPKQLHSFTTKVAGLFFNNPWKWSQLKKERNSTFSQIQLLNNLNESYLSLLKTTPTLCSLMWTEKKKIMHQRAEYEPMQTACSAPWTVVTVLAEAFPQRALQRVSTPAHLANWAPGFACR